MTHQERGSPQPPDSPRLGLGCLVCSTPLQQRSEGQTKSNSDILFSFTWGSVAAECDWILLRHTRRMSSLKGWGVKVGQPASPENTSWRDMKEISFSRQVYLVLVFVLTTQSSKNTMPAPAEQERTFTWRGQAYN